MIARFSARLAPIPLCIGAAIVLAVAAGGCRPSADLLPQLTAASAAERANRRAYSGAPPVIPHERLGSACVTCHTETGRLTPTVGVAPANPHLGSSGDDRMDNCRQCHVFQSNAAPLAANSFEGLRRPLLGDRLFPGAPPCIPHPVRLRENCQACHSGVAARPEVRCTHPERENCRQCHMQSVDGLGLARGRGLLNNRALIDRERKSDGE